MPTPPRDPQERYNQLRCPTCRSTGPHRVREFFEGSRITCGTCDYAWDVDDDPPLVRRTPDAD